MNYDDFKKAETIKIWLRAQCLKDILKKEKEREKEKEKRKK